MSATQIRLKSRIVGITVMTSVLAVVIIAGFLFGPQVLRSVSGEVVQGDAPVTVTTAGATAEIPLAHGWSFRPALWDQSRVTLRSPDGHMSIDLRLVRDVDAAESARAATGAPIDSFDTEPVGDAMLLHAHTKGDAVVGALTRGDDALTFVSTPSPAYDAELAALLATIRFTS